MTFLYRIINKLRKLFFRYVLTTKIEKFLKKTGIYFLLKYLFSGLQKIIFKMESLRPETEKTFNIKGIQATFKVSTGKERQLFYGNKLSSSNLPALTKILDTLNESDIFWDVGANVGLYSCFIGQAIKTGNLVCFEPHPANVKRLKENLRLNEIQDAKVIEAGLSDKNDTIYFKAKSNEAGSLGEITKEKTSIPVPIYRGDTIADKENLAVPQVIKMDIAGEEWNTIQGLENILDNKNCQMLICELHPRGIEQRGGTVSEFMAQMENYGFESEELRSGASSFVPHYIFSKI